MLKYVDTLVGFSEVPKKWSVYMHIFPNNKTYVGITSKLPKLRWGYLGHNYYKTGHHVILLNAIEKYGWNNIKHIILCKTTKERACLLEKTLIKYYKHKKLSYNIADGGEGTIGVSRIPWNKGKSCSEETKHKISIANRGKVSYWKGKHLSESTKLKISKTRLERKIKVVNKSSIKTLLYKDNVRVKTFNSGVELAKHFNVSPSYINNCIKHNRPYKGFKIILEKVC